MLTAIPNGPTWNSYSLTGLEQTSTNSFTDVAGSQFDLALCRNGNGSYSIVWKSGNSVTAQLYGSNDAATWIAVGSTVAVDTGTHTASVLFGPSQTSWYRYYKLQIEDTSGGSHGIVDVTGFAL